MKVFILVLAQRSQKGEIHSISGERLFQIDGVILLLFFLFLFWLVLLSILWGATFVSNRLVK